MQHSVDASRGAIATGHVRYILGISLAAAILAMAVVLAIAL